MTKSLLLTLFAFLATIPRAQASSGFGCAAPSDTVQMATDIAVGVVQVSRDNGLQVRFTPQTVLKGHMQPGSTYTIDYETARDRISYAYVLPQIAAYAEGKPAVLFLGCLLPNGRTLMPEGMEGAVWPRLQEKWPPFQTPDTLEECITFVKALLANPQLKLKRVKKREFLPDGYTPPSVATPPSDEEREENRLMTYLPPAAAVARATDIVMGSVQVDREQGLPLRLTVQSVLKGNMQPGAICSVDYAPRREGYLPMVATAVEGKSTVMLLGKLHSDGKTFEPEGWDSAVWPRSVKWGGVFQTPDTLEGCVTFVKALVANPKLKLKIVNDREMLPDDFSPPSGTPKAP